jgi:hypothetical protein
MIGSHCETGDVRQKADFVSESNPALSQALKAQEASFCKRMGRGIYGASDLGCRSNCWIRVSSILAKPRVKKV